LNKARTSEETEHRRPEATIETSVTVVRVGRRPKLPFLRLIEGPGAPKKFTLNQPEMIVGRDEKAHITVPSANVSRQHALIKSRLPEVSICDFDSRNGVFLNGIKVHSAVLRDGDIIQLADAVFEFYED